MLIGHDRAWRAWNEAMAGERMHHAWLLVGNRGLGKASFAQAAARMLVGAAPDSGDHPDVLTLTYGPKNKDEAKKRDDGKPFELARGIKVDQVREIQRRLTTRPTMGARRAIVIDPTDDLEVAASNALLKSLEEPPSGTYFLLVAHRPARLLPTIRSRCRTLRFTALDDRQMEGVLATVVPEASLASRNAAIAAAAGSPGAALGFVAMDLGPVAELLDAILDSGDADFVLRGQLAAAIGTRPDRDRLKGVFDLASAAVARRAEQGLRDPRRLIDAHCELARLGGEAPTYNYDAGLLAMEIGTLLAHAAPASERGNG